jgi:hypothetical protein
LASSIFASIAFFCIVDRFAIEHADGSLSRRLYLIPSYGSAKLPVVRVGENDRLATDRQLVRPGSSRRQASTRGFDLMYGSPRLETVCSYFADGKREFVNPVLWEQEVQLQIRERC